MSTAKASTEVQCKFNFGAPFHTSRSAVWNLVGMEIVGPYKKTAQENQYVVTMACYFSKWIEAYMPFLTKLAEPLLQGSIYMAEHCY